LDNLAVTAVGNMLKGKAQDGTGKSHFKRVKLAVSAEGNKCRKTKHRTVPNYPISSAVKLALSALETTVERSSRCWEQ
jgi:hypothetical protein